MRSKAEIEEMENMIREHLEKYSDHFTERDVEVLKYRFGITDGEQKSLEETTEKFGISRERVRQIEAKMLFKRPRDTTKKLKYVGV